MRVMEIRQDGKLVLDPGVTALPAIAAHLRVDSTFWAIDAATLTIGRCEERLARLKGVPDTPQTVVERNAVALELEAAQEALLVAEATLPRLDREAHETKATTDHEILWRLRRMADWMREGEIVGAVQRDLLFAVLRDVEDMMQQGQG